MTEKTLYERLGGYDGISTFVFDLIPRLQGDAKLGRFWQNRPTDSVAREKQLLIDYLCTNSGGQTVYTGRDMLTSHAGMGIDEEDWSAFLGHAGETFKVLQVGEQEVNDVVAFVLSLKSDVVD